MPIHVKPFFFLLVSLISLGISTPARSASTYESLFKSMNARQQRIESILMDPKHCLGERLDGYLEINSNCSPEEILLAEEENLDRKALHELMASDLKNDPQQVGMERAKRYMDRYKPGVLREVTVSGTEKTWWDGRPPDPRKTALSRVLALRYARIHEHPDASSLVVRDNIQQYEAFGVVDSTKNAAGDLWYKVTEEYVPKVKPPGWSPHILGWIAEKESIPWKRALVMRFTNPYMRDPSFFFREPSSILKLIEQTSSDRNKQLNRIRSQFDAGSAGADGVIAMEPQVGSGQEQVIMYPVLDFYTPNNGEDIRIEGKYARVLEVAARTRTEGASSSGVKSIPIDILFVMDTTESMKPYLQRVLAAATEFVATGGDEEIRFGFVGYRDKDPKFSYMVKEYSTTVESPKKFVETLMGVTAQNIVVRGDDIPEAVFEGVDEALESSQWRQDAIKIIFLVGDAPGREETFSVKMLRDKAHTRKIDIFAFHIQNSSVSGGLDQQSKNQYRTLSSTYTGAYGTSPETSHLLSVDARSAEFGKLILDRFLETKIGFEDIRKAVQSGSRELPAAEAGSLSELIFQQAMLLLPDNTLPDQEVRGWVCDRVLIDPGREALAPMILLTETELDELEQRVRELRDLGVKALRGEEGTTLDFFDLVSRNTRFTMVDPTAVNFRDAFSVPLGIDQLPYLSDIMGTTRDEFQNPDRVGEFVRSMDSKLNHYEDLRRKRGDRAIWKKLNVATDEKDSVVCVELNHLP